MKNKGIYEATFKQEVVCHPGGKIETFPDKKDNILSKLEKECLQRGQPVSPNSLDTAEFDWLFREGEQTHITQIKVKRSYVNSQEGYIREIILNTMPNAYPDPKLRKILEESGYQKVG